MPLLYFDNFLANTSFGVLLVSMLVYWLRAAFFVQSKTFGNSLRQFGFGGTLLANLLIAFLLISRWVESQHFPLSNLYESLLFLAWGIGIVQLFLETKTKENLIGVIFSPMVLFIDAFATLTLPAQMQEGAPLVPALKSNWLMMHVSIMMLSYSTLLAGSLIAIAFLIISKNKNQLSTSFEQRLDQLSYRALGVGFPMLTLGILSGAIWANEAWGSYWSWDPKETWALITWLVFAIYFHFRITYGWKGKKPAMVASFGFVIVWVCYLGVNLFGTGLHSYGWLTT
jgi:cytochrome c-type biogenesis protein CcsB